MATVTQKPDTISFLRNLKAYKINSSEVVSFKLLKGGKTILEETYYPDATDNITIDIKDVVAQYLKVELPTNDTFSQISSASAVLYAYVDGISIGLVRVLPGGVRGLTSATDWLKANWLTWQPQTKLVRWNQPEYLSYYSQSAGYVKARFYTLAGETEIVTIYNVTATNYVSYDMEMAHLFSFSDHDQSELNGYVDVWVEDSSGTRLTYIQRYVLTPNTMDEHYYMCVNSLGGIDTFCFTGARTLAPSIEHESAIQDEKKINITGNIERAWQQNTGMMGKTESKWLWDFFAGSRHWTIIDSNAEEIMIDSSSIKASDADNLNSSDFNFTLISDGELLNIQRTADALPPISVPSPTGELFFLTPRLIDYPDAQLTDDLLFLVQSPFVQEWKKVSLATLKAWIETIFLPYSELPLRLEIIVESGDSFLAWGESLSLSCRVWKGLYEEVTNSVTSWSISRNSGVPIEDAAWLLKAKVKAFDGTFEINFNESENDLGESSTATGTIFTIKANIDDQTAKADIVI